MGMDVYGKNPASEEGKYFRANVWSWRPIADMVEELYPDLYAKATYWHTNDGDGLDDEDAAELGTRILSDIEACRIRAWLAHRKAQLDALPNEECTLCDGTGIRTDNIGQEMAQPKKVIGKDTGADTDHPRYGETGWCNGCDGKGWVRPWATAYSTDIEHIAEFGRFCRDSGGFEIC